MAKETGRFDDIEESLRVHDSISSNILDAEYSSVAGEITRCFDNLREEAKEVEANVQLDKNLEQRRRGEVFQINDALKKARSHVNRFTEDTSKSLISTSNAILLGIGGFAVFIVGAVGTYKIIAH